jgi:release factor glutamine methyltransferase
MESVGTSAEDLVDDAAQILRGAGIEQAGLEARWLLARVLNISESSLLAHPNAAVDPADASRYRQAVRRRARREPFAYVVGERELYGRTFLVDRRVLVPRPETETLVEEALAVLKFRACMPDRPALVVDVGTGSGAIACVLAQELPRATVVACDISADALAVAALNRDRLSLRDRLHLVRGNLLDWLRQPADLVVANLPYIPSARVPTLMPEVADWEPRQALDGGPDGLDLVRALLTDARRVVRPGGTILLELDPEQMAPAQTLLPNADTRVVRDLAGLDRVLRLDLP